MSFRCILYGVLLCCVVSACSSEDNSQSVDGGTLDSAASDASILDDGSVDVALEDQSIPPAVTGTNSNACLVDLGGLQPVCPTADGTEAPTEACCIAFKAFQEDACSCSPFIEELMGVDTNGFSLMTKMVNGLELLCPGLGVTLPDLDCSAAEAPSGISTGAAKTYAGGTCPHSDREMDRMRFASAIGFRLAFEVAEDESLCLDTPGLKNLLAAVSTPELQVRVPYGIGVYTGYDGAAEYLGISFAGLNHGLWRPNFIDVDVTQRAELRVSEDGHMWTLGTTTSGLLFNDLVSYDDVYLAQDVTFEGCDTRFSVYELIPTESMRDLIEYYVYGATLFKRWGAQDICRYHTEFCASSPETRQYDSEQECLDFMATLPTYSEACGINRPLAGLSLPCKFKHHFMIPANPSLHCPHIGRPGSHDPDHKLKCDDAVECSDPSQGEDWPAVSRIGDNTPQSILDAAAANNVGFEDEALGCALPTQP